MSRKKRPLALVAALAVTLGVAGTALAAANSLAVKGPIAAAEGTSFPLKVRGYANQPAGVADPADEVVAWRTAVACKRGYAGEVTAAKGAPTLKSAVSGMFHKSVTVVAGSGGTMYWCAYLINETTHKTFKAAFLTYSELGRGPGGPPGGAP